MLRKRLDLKMGFILSFEGMSTTSELNGGWEFLLKWLT